MSPPEEGNRTVVELATQEGERRSSPLRGSLKVSSVTLALSLATWYVFFVYGMPLNAKDTSVVVGFWLAVVLVSRGLWRWARNPGEQKR